MRQNILDNLGITSDYIFITNTGKPFQKQNFHDEVRKTWQHKKLWTGPRSCGSHGFRKFFEQEASPPDRGISKAYISFMMGHSEGKGNSHPLDAVGGVYDKTPFTYPKVVEKEYIKLEQYINIYTGNQPRTTINGVELEPETEELLINFIKDLKTGKINITRRQ